MGFNSSFLCASASQDTLGDALGALCALGPPRRAGAGGGGPGRPRAAEAPPGGPSRRELALAALASLGPDGRGSDEFFAARSLLLAATSAHLWLWDLLLDRCLEEALGRHEASLAVAAALHEALGGPHAEASADDGGVPRRESSATAGRSGRRAVGALVRGLERLESGLKGGGAGTGWLEGADGRRSSGRPAATRLPPSVDRSSLCALIFPLGRLASSRSEPADAASARALAECLRGVAAALRVLESVQEAGRRDRDRRQKGAEKCSGDAAQGSAWRGGETATPAEADVSSLLDALRDGARALSAALVRPGAATAAVSAALVRQGATTDAISVAQATPPGASPRASTASPEALRLSPSPSPKAPPPSPSALPLSLPLRSRHDVLDALFALESLLDVAGRGGLGGKAAVAGVLAGAEIAAPGKGGKCGGDRAALYALLAAHGGIEAALCSPKAPPFCEAKPGRGDAAPGPSTPCSSIEKRRPAVSSQGVAGVLRVLLRSGEDDEAGGEMLSDSLPALRSTPHRSPSPQGPSRPIASAPAARSARRPRWCDHASPAAKPPFPSLARDRPSLCSAGVDRVQPALTRRGGAESEDARAETVAEEKTSSRGDCERGGSAPRESSSPCATPRPRASAPPSPVALSSASRSPRSPTSTPSASSRWRRLPDGGLSVTLSRQHFPGRIIFPTNEGFAIASCIFGDEWFADLLAQPNGQSQKSKEATIRAFGGGCGEKAESPGPASEADDGRGSSTSVDGINGAAPARSSHRPASSAAIVRVYHRTARSPVYVMGPGVADLFKRRGAQPGWKVCLSPGPAPGEAWVSVREGDEAGETDEFGVRAAAERAAPTSPPLPRATSPPAVKREAPADGATNGKHGALPRRERDAPRVDSSAGCAIVSRPACEAKHEATRASKASVGALLPPTPLSFSLPPPLANAPPPSFLDRPPAREALASARSASQAFFLPRSMVEGDVAGACRSLQIPGLLAQAASLARRSSAGAAVLPSRSAPSDLPAIAEALLSLAVVRLFEPRADGAGLVSREESAGPRRSSLSARRSGVGRRGATVAPEVAEASAGTRRMALEILRRVSAVFDAQEAAGLDRDGAKENCDVGAKGCGTEKQGAKAGAVSRSREVGNGGPRRKRITLAPASQGAIEPERLTGASPQTSAIDGEKPTRNDPYAAGLRAATPTTAAPRRRIVPLAVEPSAGRNRVVPLAVEPSAGRKRIEPQAISPLASRKRIELQAIASPAAPSNPFFAVPAPAASPAPFFDCLATAAPPPVSEPSGARRLLRTAMTSENPLEREAAWAAYIADKEAMLALMDDQAGAEAADGRWAGQERGALGGTARLPANGSRSQPAAADGGAGKSESARVPASSRDAQKPSSPPTPAASAPPPSLPPTAAHPDRAVATALAAELAWTGPGSPPAAWAALLGAASELLLAASRAPATRTPCDPQVAQRLAGEAINAYDASLGSRPRSRVAKALGRDAGLALAAALALVRRGLGGDWARPGDVRGAAALATLRLAGAALREGVDGGASEGEDGRDELAHEAVVPALLGCWPGATDLGGPLGIAEKGAEGGGERRGEEQERGGEGDGEDPAEGSRAGKDQKDSRRDPAPAKEAPAPPPSPPPSLATGAAFGSREETALLGARLWVFLVDTASPVVCDRSPPPWAAKRLRGATGRRSDAVAARLSDPTRETCPGLLASFFARAVDAPRGGSMPSSASPRARASAPPDPLALRMALDVAAATAAASEAADLLARSSPFSAAALTETLVAALGACSHSLADAEARLLRRLWSGTAGGGARGEEQGERAGAMGVEGGFQNDAAARGGHVSANGSAVSASGVAPNRPASHPPRALPKALDARLRLGSAAAAFAIALRPWLARAQARERDRVSGRSSLFSRSRDPSRHLVCSPAAFDARVAAGADAAVALAARVDALVRGAWTEGGCAGADARALAGCWSAGRDPLPGLERSDVWLPEGEGRGEADQGPSESEASGEEKSDEETDWSSEEDGCDRGGVGELEGDRFESRSTVEREEKERGVSGSGRAPVHNRPSLAFSSSSSSSASRPASQRSARCRLPETSNGYLAAILRESRARSRPRKRAKRSARGSRGGFGARPDASSASSESEDVSDLSDLEDFIVANPERDYDAFIAAHFPTRDEEEGAEEVWGPAAGQGEAGGELGWEERAWGAGRDREER